MGMRIASIAIFVVFSLGLPAQAQSIDRQDLDCATAASTARADQGTTGENGSSELLRFFIDRLYARDDQTNWARVAYDRAQFYRKRDWSELLEKCTELYRSALQR
jgi:hypothetical protein